MRRHIAAKFVHLFVFGTLSLVKQLQAWFISALPDKERKHWLMMPNHVSTHVEVIATWHSLLIHRNRNQYVIHLLITVVNQLQQLSRRACHPEERPAHRLADKTVGQCQTNRLRDSPCTCPSHLKQSSNAGKHATSCHWFPLATGQISHLTQSSKADHHANSCQWFPLAAVQIQRNMSVVPPGSS